LHHYSKGKSKVNRFRSEKRRNVCAKKAKKSEKIPAAFREKRRRKWEITMFSAE
jgi:hypothetical protein